METIFCGSLHDCSGSLAGEFPFFRNCDCFYNLGKGPYQPHEFQELSETLELCLLSESYLSLLSGKKCFNLEYIAIPQHLRHLFLSQHLCLVILFSYISFWVLISKQLQGEEQDSDTLYVQDVPSGSYVQTSAWYCHMVIRKREPRRRFQVLGCMLKKSGGPCSLSLSLSLFSYCHCEQFSLLCAPAMLCYFVQFISHPESY